MGKEIGMLPLLSEGATCRLEIISEERKMTEDRIERSVEAKIDSADEAFMAGKISQERYDARMKEIKAWADAQYAKVRS